MEDGPTASSSSTAPAPGTGQKRAADVGTEVLADETETDIMMMNVGPAYTTHSDGGICEVYSPPRVVPHAERAGFGPGWSLDLTTKDPQGRAWDFCRADCRAAARKLVLEQRPLLLIGSPMCTWFSILQEFDQARKQTLAWQEGYRKAVAHIKFVFELYDLQLQGGRYFLHEHPASATSWRLPEVVAFCAQHPQLYAVLGDMCQFGMTTAEPGGEKTPAKKRTRWLTNSACLAEALDRKCLGEHEHVALLNGRGAAAQVYPPQLCRTIVAAFARQLRLDNQLGPQELSTAETSCYTIFADRQVERAEIDSSAVPPVLAAPVAVPVFNLDILQVDADDGDQEAWEATDDVHGGVLPSDLVRAARKREIEFLHARKVYSRSTTAEAWRLTRKAPLKLKWIDTNKGDRRVFNIRSRLVCTEIRRKGVEARFSATPPLESLRMLVARAASENPGQSRPSPSAPVAATDPYKMMLIDVSRAHFYASAVRDVFIQLPAEDPLSSTPGACGKLEKTMYGTLDAAERWAEHYAEVLRAAGFVRGTASPCHFYHAARDIWMLVHGDDFVAVARSEGRAYLEATLRGSYEIKIDIAGPEEQDAKELKVLGRIVSYGPRGISYEPDPGHMEAVIHELGLGTAKGVVTPGVKDESEVSAAEVLERRRSYAPPSLSVGPAGEVFEGVPPALGELPSPPLVGEALSRYQSLAARLNYYSLDRPDLMYPVKELMRKLSAPTVEDFGRLKRVARYLISAPRMVVEYPWAPLSSVLTIFTDSDHAGCLRTRKSTSGGVVLWGRALIKAWSRTQTLIALSSGESELAAVTKAAAEGLGARSVLSDFGFPVSIEVHSDATAAIGICKRQGLGRVRHLATADLWLQQRVKARDLTLYKVPGRHNPSDLLTKHKSHPEIVRFLHMMGIRSRDGRPSLAPARVPAVA